MDFLDPLLGYGSDEFLEKPFVDSRSWCFIMLLFAHRHGTFELAMVRGLAWNRFSGLSTLWLPKKQACATGLNG